ncbi:DUF2238 domain-containing protein [Candidatus Woesearchaeota archaeon]|nr:DUF2238 domain-containing protein [Candidatus Woesearchaeota archaeon]
MKNKASNYPNYLFFIYIAVWILLAISPTNRFNWFLENIIVFVFIPIIVLIHCKSRLSNASYTLIAIYLILHAIGAHYTYSETPFFSSFLGHKFERDHYDRLTHFAFGLLMYYPIRDFIRKNVKTKGVWSYYIPWAAVVSFSAIYELLEWFAALIFAPEHVITFMGMQGDSFDAQKDMLLAAAGALIALLLGYMKIKIFKK